MSRRKRVGIKQVQDSTRDHPSFIPFAKINRDGARRRRATSTRTVVIQNQFSSTAMGLKEKTRSTAVTQTWRRTGGFNFHVLLWLICEVQFVNHSSHFVSFARKHKTLLVHGIESDWIEDEMGDDDEDFINIVLEQKVKAAFAKAGWAKKLNLLEVFRWSDGPLHRSHPPVVVTFKSWLESQKRFLPFFLQEGEKAVIKPPTSRLAEYGDCTHRRLQVHGPASLFFSFPGPDWLDQKQKPPNSSPSMSSSTTTRSLTLVTPAWEYLMSGLNWCDNNWEYNKRETILKN